MDPRIIKNTYKYHLKLGYKVVEKGITYDLIRRETEKQKEFQGSRIKQIGRRTTREAAEKWLRNEGKRKYKKDIKPIKQDIEILPSDNYYQIIQVNVPVRFYWSIDTKDFDSVEIGPFNNCTNKIKVLLNRIIDIVIDNGEEE